MDEEFNHVLHLLERFTCQDNKIRVESEHEYQDFEQDNPEKAIEILFQIINSNCSFNPVQQALIRLRFFLKNASSPSPSISLEIANNIKSFLLEYINISDNQILKKYSISIILSFYFKTFTVNGMWDDFLPYLIDLYSKEPVIALNSLTIIYQSNKSQEVASQIYSFMNFDQDNELCIQSIISGLILIKYQFFFDNYGDFIGSLVSIFSTISDDDLFEPLDTFYNSYIYFYEPFLPSIPDIFKYFLDTISDISRSENIRVQCMYIVRELTSKSSEFRAVVLSNASDVANAISIAISQPFQYDKIYEEAKDSLKCILDDSLGDREVFDESFKELGMSDNIYVKTTFLYYIPSDKSLEFALDNVFHEEQIIRQDCINIIFRMVSVSHQQEKKKTEEEQDQPSLRDAVEERVVDIFVEYLRQQNFEIFDFFKYWCETGGSESLEKCIDPIIELLEMKCYEESVLIMASLLCKLYPENPILQEVASDLLELSKKCISEQNDNQECKEIFLEIIRNLISILDREDQLSFLDEIMPYIFNSASLSVSSFFLPIIETLDKDFIPYIPDYMNVLFDVSSSILEDGPISTNALEIGRNPGKSGIIVDYDTAFFYSDDDLRTLSSMIQALGIVFMEYTDVCGDNVDILLNILKVIQSYVAFPYDDEIQGEAITLCNNFVIKYGNIEEIDVIQELSRFVIKGVEMTSDWETLSSFASFDLFAIKKAKQDHDMIPFCSLLLYLIFSNFIDSIKEIDEKDRYIDGVEEEFMFQLCEGIAKGFELIFDLDKPSAVKLFKMFSDIMPYFNLPNLYDDLKYLISVIWVNFLCYAPPEEFPEHIPNIIDDLFEFYSNACDDKIRERIVIEIGLFTYNFSPQDSPSILVGFENIISDNDEELNVKETAAVQYSSLLTKIEDPDLFSDKFDNLVQMFELFQSDSENAGYFSEYLVELAKFTIENNCEEASTQKLIDVITSFIDQKLLSKKNFKHIVKKIADFEPLQSFCQYIQMSFEEYLQYEEEEEENDEE